LGTNFIKNIKMNQIRKQFKKLFADVYQNAGEIIELQLNCVEERMDVLDAEGRHKDLIALGQEYIEWANAENGDDYGFLFVGPIEEN
jgi:hypothetical protein